MKNLLTQPGGGALGLNTSEDALLGSRENGGISLKSSQGANFALEDKGALGSKGRQGAYKSQNDISFTSLRAKRSNPEQKQKRLPRRADALLAMTNKCAFTLSEVLITLGIIGVVAALAIPTLISNNNKRVVETRLAKFYSSINQAIELSEVENGPKEKWDDLTQDADINYNWFKKYMEPYISYNKIVKESDGRLAIFQNDGSAFTILSGGWRFYPKSEIYDPNKVDNGEKLGKESFIFLFRPTLTDDTRYKFHVKKGVEPYQWNWDGTEETLRGNNYGCSEDGWGHYCTQLIRMNGWKIPDDYPYKF